MSKAFQIGTITSLFSGEIRGDLSLDDIKKHGNFGIGTYDFLDDEMIFLDGKFYQTKRDGKIKIGSKVLKTPFATVTFFEKSKPFKMESRNLKEMERAIDEKISFRNVVHFLRVKGSFSKLFLRSAIRQKRFSIDRFKQSEYLLEGRRGTLVGTYFPSFLRNINVEGYHFHFIDEEKKLGGHLFEIKEMKAHVEICPCFDLSLHIVCKGPFVKAKPLEGLQSRIQRIERR